MIQGYLKILNALLMGLILVLGVMLYRDWKGFDSASLTHRQHTAPRRSPHKAIPVPNTGLFAAEPKHDFGFYQQVIDLDLFRAERKKPESEGKSGPSQARPAGSFDRRFKLLGIAQVGNRKLALLSFHDRDPKTKQIRQITKIVREGQRVRDFRVDKVAEAYIVLSVNDEKVEVRLNPPTESARGRSRRR